MKPKVTRWELPQDVGRGFVFSATSTPRLSFAVNHMLETSVQLKDFSSLFPVRNMQKQGMQSSQQKSRDKHIQAFDVKDTYLPTQTRKKKKHVCFDKTFLCFYSNIHSSLNGKGIFFNILFKLII